MEKIIAEELEVLKRLLEKIYEKVPSLEEADRNGFEACRTTMCRINERYAEFVDDAIRHAKAERKKMVHRLTLMVQATMAIKYREYLTRRENGWKKICGRLLPNKDRFVGIISFELRY